MVKIKSLVWALLPLQFNITVSLQKEGIWTQTDGHTEKKPYVSMKAEPG